MQNIMCAPRITQKTVTVWAPLSPCIVLLSYLTMNSGHRCPLVLVDSRVVISTALGLPCCWLYHYLSFLHITANDCWRQCVPNSDSWQSQTNVFELLSVLQISGLLEFRQAALIFTVRCRLLGCALPVSSYRVTQYAYNTGLYACI